MLDLVGLLYGIVQSDVHIQYRDKEYIWHILLSFI